MCTTQEGLSLMQPRKRNVSKMCMKCSCTAVVVVRGMDSLCRDCFTGYVTHKFRSTLGKSKVVRQGDKVLLALSGGPSSSCMLHLVIEGLKENVHKKLRFIPAVAHIMEDVDMHGFQDSESLKHNIQQIKDTVERANFSLHLISFRQFLKNVDAVMDDIPKAAGIEMHSTVEERLRLTKSQTALEDIMYNLRIRILKDLARRHGYTKILLGESATRLSIKLLSNIALGKGSSIPLEISVADTRETDVVLVRPLREISSKEVAFYNVFQGVSTISSSHFHSKVSSKSSLQLQTEYFINELQVNFPSTVNTVFRTGDKLRINEDLPKSCYRCAFCQGPILLNTDTRSFGISGPDIFPEEAGDLSIDPRSSKIEGNLCYGCAITATETGIRPGEFTTCTAGRGRIVSDSEHLRCEIEDFLIE